MTHGTQDIVLLVAKIYYIIRMQSRITRGKKAHGVISRRYSQSPLSGVTQYALNSPSKKS